MAGGFSTTVVMGRVGRAPELKYTAAGKAVLNLGLAVNFRGRNAGGEPEEQTQWYEAVFWEKTAEIAAQYLQKGSEVLVQGVMRSRTYEKDGAQQTRWELTVHEMTLIGGRGAGTTDQSAVAVPQAAAPGGYGQTAAAPYGAAQGGYGSKPLAVGSVRPPIGRGATGDIDDDDIPF